MQPRTTRHPGSPPRASGLEPRNLLCFIQAHLARRQLPRYPHQEGLDADLQSSGMAALVCRLVFAAHCHCPTSPHVSDAAVPDYRAGCRRGQRPRAGPADGVVLLPGRRRQGAPPGAGPARCSHPAGDRPPGMLLHTRPSTPPGLLGNWPAASVCVSAVCRVAPSHAVTAAARAVAHARAVLGCNRAV